MIKVTGINNKSFYLNCEHIEKIEEVPESMITLVNGKKYLITESVEEILQEVYEYKKSIFAFGMKEAMRHEKE